MTRRWHHFYCEKMVGLTLAYFWHTIHAFIATAFKERLGRWLDFLSAKLPFTSMIAHVWLLSTQMVLCVVNWKDRLLELLVRVVGKFYQDGAHGQWRRLYATPRPHAAAAIVGMPHPAHPMVAGVRLPPPLTPTAATLTACALNSSAHIRKSDSRARCPTKAIQLELDNHIFQAIPW